MDGVTLDGKKYMVRVKLDSLGRSFRIENGENAGDLMSGRYFRDVKGTYYDYSMQVEPHPLHLSDYDAFYEAISAPVESHMLTVPYNGKTITFEAMVTGGSDTLAQRLGDRERWKELKVDFTAIEPYRTPAGG